MNSPEVRFRPLPPDLQDSAEEQLAWSSVPIDQYEDRTSQPNQERGATFADGTTEFMPFYQLTPEGVMYTLRCTPFGESDKDDTPENYLILHNGSLCAMRRYYLPDIEPLDIWREPTDEDLQLLAHAVAIMQGRKQPFDAWEAEFGLEDELAKVINDTLIPESEVEPEPEDAPQPKPKPDTATEPQAEQQALHPVTTLYSHMGRMTLATMSYLGHTARHARQQAQAWMQTPHKRAA